MKLVRFGEFGEERPGILLEEAGKEMILDVRAMAFDMEEIRNFEGIFGIKVSEWVKPMLAKVSTIKLSSRSKATPATGVALSIASMYMIGQLL